MIVQNVSEDGKTTNLTFTASRGELARALAAIEARPPRSASRRHP